MKQKVITDDVKMGLYFGSIAGLVAGLLLGVLVAFAINKCNAWGDGDAPLYTEADAKMLAKMLYGECRGVKSDTEKAACAWVVLNRVDASGWSNTISGVVTARSQFVGYRTKNPVWPELLELAEDVLGRWEREKAGESNVGRVIPAGYYFFTADGRLGNRFRKDFKSKSYWDWSLPSPYTE